MRKIALVVLLLLTLVGCTKNVSLSEFDELPNDISSTINQDYGDYHIKVLVIKGESNSYLEIYQHLVSTTHVNVTVKSVCFDKLKNNSNLNEFDLIYPDYSILESKNFNKKTFVKTITSYVENGGNIVLEHPFYEVFSKEFLGVTKFTTVNDNEYEFTYPTISKNYEEVQNIYKMFLDDAKKAKYYNKDVFSIDVAAKVNTATSIVDVKGLSIALNNTYKKGNVIWFNKAMLNRKAYITRLDFQKSCESQTHFHFGFNSMNWLLRNKLYNIVAKNKYGYALEKVMGPYSRPGLSWQNHFEEYNGFRSKDMIRFTELLKDYNQIPSYSLVRGTYRWGKWKNSITVNLNKQTTNNPLYTNYTPNSFYGTGKRVNYNNGLNLDLGWHTSYKTLMSSIEAPTRAYIGIGDMTGNGKDDFIVGNHLGDIYCLPNVSKGDIPEFNKKIPLSTNKNNINLPYAAPAVADLNGDGKLDMVVGDKEGNLTTYINSSKFIFNKTETLNYKIGSYLAPNLMDWNGDGTLDLIVGNDIGEIYIMNGSKNNSTIEFNEPQLLTTTKLKWIAPFCYDYNNDQKLDILVGSYNGQISVFLNKNGKLEYDHVIKGHNKNMHGDNTINFGHNTVPVMYDWNKDGAIDLVIGGLEYGAPYTIDDPNLPIKKQVNANIDYAKRNFLEIDLHIYEHAFKSSDEEREEYNLHFNAMKNLGLNTKNVGVNHHTWTTNVDTLTNLKNQQDFGVFYNFGFRPYGSTGSPRDSISFVPAIAPFQLVTDEEKQEFIYWCPAPVPYSNSMKAMIKYDLPLTFFEHVECRLNKGTKYYKSLVKSIKEVGMYHDNGNYNFMTERQIAKSLMNMYYSNLKVIKDEDGITITPLHNNVPSTVEEYKNTLGIKFIPGSNYKHKITTNALIQTSIDNNDALYVGVNKDVKICWSEEAVSNNSFITITKSNVPIILKEIDNNTLILKLNSIGMQQVTIKADTNLNINGDHIKIDKQNNNLYTITHYGDVCVIKISK